MLTLNAYKLIECEHSLWITISQVWKTHHQRVGNTAQLVNVKSEKHILFLQASAISGVEWSGRHTGDGQQSNGCCHRESIRVNLAKSSSTNTSSKRKTKNKTQWISDPFLHTLGLAHGLALGCVCVRHGQHQRATLNQGGSPSVVIGLWPWFIFYLAHLRLVFAQLESRFHRRHYSAVQSPLWSRLLPLALRCAYFAAQYSHLSLRSGLLRSESAILCTISLKKFPLLLWMFYVLLFFPLSLYTLQFSTFILWRLTYCGSFYLPLNCYLLYYLLAYSIFFIPFITSESEPLAWFRLAYIHSGTKRPFWSSDFLPCFF